MFIAYPYNKVCYKAIFLISKLFDLALTEEEIIVIYGKRWSIEVFFKVCKSYIKLGKEFQGISYDATTAHTPIVMIRYIYHVNTVEIVTSSNWHDIAKLKAVK